jgi:hypothetical protein
MACDREISGGKIAEITIFNRLNNLPISLDGAVAKRGPLG